MEHGKVEGCGSEDRVNRHERQLTAGWERIENHDRQIGHLNEVVESLARGDAKLRETMLVMFSEHESKDRKRAEEDQRYRTGIMVTSVLSLMGIGATLMTVISKG